jgi:hypothetical protein
VTAVMRLRYLELAANGNHSGIRYKIPIGASAQALPGIVVGPIWSMFGAENGDADRWHGSLMSQQPSSILALPRPVMVLGAAVTLLIAAAVALWVHYGTAVFYEMIAAGVAWCL